MSESPEPPPKKSTSGRIISATKQKLSAPISMFVKTICPKKKARVTESDGASSVQETGTASSIQEGRSTSVKFCRKVIISDEEDEEESSHRGQTLSHNSDTILILDDEANEITAEKQLGI